MKSKIALSTIFLAGILVLSSGCRKWLDINKDPNVADNVPVNMLLSSAEVSIASGVGTYLQINGGIWSQYWTQSPSANQYNIYDQYAPSANDYDRPWATFYSSALMNLEVLEQKARATNARDYLAVSMILKAYTFQVITDAWGDVPFSQALKARPEDGGIVSPKYDSQEEVYAGINAMIDSARTIIEELQGSNIEGDLIYGGDLSVWWKFANTLQLKTYLRLSIKSPAVAQAGITKVYGIAGDESGFLGEGEDAQINFSTTPGNQNPLFSEITGLGGTENLVASSTVVDSMNNNDDYRAYALYTYNPGTGLITGIPQGFYNINPVPSFISKPTAFTGAAAPDDNSGAAPVRFITGYESLFLQAEATVRYPAITGQDDEALFYAATEVNFNSMDAEFQEVLGVTAADAFYVYTQGDTVNAIPPGYWGVYPTGGTQTERIRHIITQKWFSMTGTQGFEAWTEQRRTGFPDFFTLSKNRIIGDKFPVRFLYPNVELTRNQNFPGQQFIDQKVWWDIN